MKLKSPLARTLRAIAGALESLNDQELEALVAGKGRLVYMADDQVSEVDSRPIVDTEPLQTRLNSCKSREEGRDVLSNISNKEALASLARSLRIHVAKHDRREDIESKIVEAVIGAKLRSEAIQSLNMKGSSPVAAQSATAVDTALEGGRS